MENSLAAMRPEIVTEWSPRNLPLSPEDISYGSKKVFWWRGKCGHEWKASAKARSQGEKCPLCAGKRIIPGINDLASLMPNLAAEWSPRNPMPAETVGIGSHKKAVWKGKCGHEWEAVIRSRAAGAGCPYCSHNRVLAGFNDLDYLFPKVAQEWSTANLPLLPWQVTAYANTKVWWVCEKGHEWKALISTRSYGSQCPYCSGIKVLTGYNDLATTHPQFVKEWSSRNGSLLPDSVNQRSTENVWWHCDACGNEYRAVIKSRVQGVGCPVCAERSVMAGYNDLTTTDPELLLEWDYEKNVDVQPFAVSRNSMRPVWWGGRCGHRWKDKIYNRTVENKGCIICEKEHQRNLPKQLILRYAVQMGMKVIFDDMDTTGILLDAFVPELKIAFVFLKRGTEKENRIIAVQKHLCNMRGIQCVVIGKSTNIENIEKRIKTTMQHKGEA